jgi:SanA protein
MKISPDNPTHLARAISRISTQRKSTSHCTRSRPGSSASGSPPNIALMMDQDTRSAGRSLDNFCDLLPIGLFWLILGGAGFFLLLCNWWVSRAGGYPLSDSVSETPENDVGLLLGTAPTLANGLPNRYFVFRMNAAAQLFHAGKVKALILSGNRRDDGYDEPAAMRKALVARGVPEQVLVEDPGGVRTRESVARAKSTFGVDRLTVISQEFHNRRALFLCRHYQIDAVALNANPVAWWRSWRLTFREFVARAAAVLNVCINGPSRRTKKGTLKVGRG